MKQLSTKKGFWYYVELIIITPFWAGSENRKPWEELKSGLIKHEHEFEETPYEINKNTYSNTHWHACKHFGCNLVHPKSYITQRGIEFEKMMFERTPEGAKTLEEYILKQEFYKDGLNEPYYSDVKTTYL